MRYLWSFLLFGTVLVVSFFGVRGVPFSRPPIEIFPDMDRQPKLKPQSEFHLWLDGRSQRPIVEGTVPRGQELERGWVFSADYTHKPSLSPEFYTGKTASGDWVRGFPKEVAIDQPFIELGKSKYEQTCFMCHGPLGDGKGMTAQFGMVGAANYGDKRIREMPEGEIFNTITHGKLKMLPLANQLTPQERWAVILYVRALQKSTTGRIEGVPSGQRESLLNNKT